MLLFLGLHFFLSISFFYNVAPKVEKEKGEALVPLNQIVSHPTKTTKSAAETRASFKLITVALRKQKPVEAHGIFFTAAPSWPRGSSFPHRYSPAVHTPTHVPGPSSWAPLVNSGATPQVLCSPVTFISFPSLVKKNK